MNQNMAESTLRRKASVPRGTVRTGSPDRAEEALQLANVRLSCLTRDAGLRFRRPSWGPSSQTATVERFAEAMQRQGGWGSFPPLVALRLGDGATQGETLLVGGYARHAAATMAGIKEAPAVIRSGTWRDALALAWKENAEDDVRPRSREELLDVIASIRTHVPGITVREVGRLAGIPKSSVHRLLGASPPAPAASWTRDMAGQIITPEPEAMMETAFHFFGSKARLAGLVWSRFGNVNRYVEPFAGSLATLLKRPDSHFDAGTTRRHETIVDANHFILNFWRAARHEPEAVARWADNPIAEADIQARHRWLTESAAAVQFRDRIAADPDFFDPKFAGWWLWGQNLWLGGGWCVRDGHKTLANWKTPRLAGCLSPERKGDLPGYIARLSARLANVVMLCGDWMQGMPEGAGIGTVGAFLDPPYPTNHGGAASRSAGLYRTDRNAELAALRDRVFSWCRELGAKSSFRIAVCGLEGDGYEYLEREHGWTVATWNESSAKANGRRERCWFSPACLPTAMAGPKLSRPGQRMKGTSEKNEGRDAVNVRPSDRLSLIREPMR